ncbi:hypothetical protein BJX63DRAFT_428448 [Aspergillus granulosus]|uniref:Uncharacterized protein n=1 Tax=Aspergillus granulosus TaxID=176169 RepID=A0ABR4HXL6_9EURO
MTVTPSGPSDDKLSALWHTACTDYAKETGTPLTNGELPQLRGAEDLSRQLDAEKDNFEDFRMKRRPLLHAMQTVLAPFENWGDLIAGVAAVAFPPASSIMGAMLLLVRGARRVSEAFDMITDLFRKLGHFALRLDSYKGVPLSEGMKVIIVKVLVNFLRVCAASQKLVSRGSMKARLAKWAKGSFVEDGEISGLFAELEELTSQEHMMVSAHSLKITHQALRNTEELLKRDNQRNNRERLQRVKAALNPVSASSQIFSSINENRIPGSGTWLEGKLRSWWEGSEPILWLHGGPGVGKSFIASKVITELARADFSAAPAPVVASFFCRNNDVDLRSLNNALRTLAWQIATQREDFAAHVEEICLKEDPGNSYVVWRKLLVNYLTQVPLQGTCLVLDGLDEAEPEEQEILDSLRGLLDEHSLAWIDDVEVGNDQSKDDLHGYVSETLQKSKLFRGSPEFREEIVNEISREAEGLWEWANLVIKSVLRCRTKEQIRKGIRTMPRGISAMLTQELQRLGRELYTSDDMFNGEESEGEGTTQIDQLNVVLSFVTLAQKPLTVTQLELILEILFKEEVLNLEDDLRTIYSSLFQLRPNTDEYSYTNDDHLVILRHSSFYEFFRTIEQSGPVGVNVDQTEVNFLYILLYSLRERQTPWAERYTGPLQEYARSFLPTHLERADPGKARKLNRNISDLIYDLFSKDDCRDWFVENVHQRNFTQYCFYATAYASDIARFWIEPTSTELINKRAEMALQWLLPETKQAFEEHARASIIASDICHFSVLFSYMAEYWLRLWLEPQDLTSGDGLPAAMPGLLTLYNKMTTEYSTDADSRQGNIGVSILRLTEVVDILAAADHKAYEKTPLWHARVAQALLLNYHYAEARERFRIVLAEHEKTPAFEALALSVIHRDLARASSEIGRHAEALEHHEISESLAEGAEKLETVPAAGLAHLLNTARLNHRARRIDAAIKTANEAWSQAVESNDWWDSDLEGFFNIFLELRQPQLLRPVFDRAFEFYEGRGRGQSGYKDFSDFLFKSLGYTTRMIYRVLQYVLTPDDEEHLDRIAAIMDRASTVEWERYNIPIYRYLLATVLFTKGRVSRGLDGWYQVVASAEDDGDVRWDIKYPTARSIGQLVSVCLDRPEISPSEHGPLALGSDDQIDEACLVLSMWLRKHGDIANSREALRGRVKHCVALLSDDDLSNDEDAYRCLFKTFIADPDSDEDREAALYLIKVPQERQLDMYNNVTQLRDASNDAGEQVSGSLKGIARMDDKVGSRDDASDAEDLNVWSLSDDLSECLRCRKGIANIHFWYFCRSRPYATVCRRCYRELQSTGDPTGILSICGAEDEFIYTGGFLCESERVDDGMVPLVSAAGERRVIWVEEWKDSLAKKWETKNFEFEGGLSAWCMRVLPEPQRTRWAAFFRT